MPIPILVKQSQFVTDTNSNGGRMTDNAVVLTVGGAGGFPILSQAEQLSGVIKARKVFAKLADATNPSVIRATVFLDALNLSGNSRSWLVAGTQRDQLNAVGTRKYATGSLNAPVVAGATVLVVDFPQGSGADTVVQAGDKIAAIEGATQNLDLYANAVSWSGDTATITLSTGVLNDFSTAAFVGSCIVDTVNVNPVADSFVKSFNGIAFDEIAHPVQVANLATIEQTLTLDFTSATDFTVLSDVLGVLANGSTGSDYAPINTAYGLPYLVIPAAGWSGSASVGDSMQLQTHPSAIPVWIFQETFANSIITNDAAYLSVVVES
jgi:hypothetical protein